MAAPLAPVGNPVSLEKLAYDAIKNAILIFRLKPGESLVENDLARQLQISKTPVRDALLRLEKEGFITKIPYKGYYVTEITRESVADMFQIRAALEGLAARLAAVHLNDADLSEIQRLVSEHEHALAEKKLLQANKLNREFHDLIILRADNERLKVMLANLDDHLQRYRTLSNYQRGRLMKSVEEHQRVVDALSAHNPEQAELALRAHILSVMEDLENQDFNELIRLASATQPE